MSELEDKVSHLQQDMTLCRRQIDTKRGDDEVRWLLLTADLEYAASANVTGFTSPTNRITDAWATRRKWSATRCATGEVKIQFLNEKFDEVKGSVSGKTLRAVDLITKKGASSGLLFYQLEIWILI